MRENNKIFRENGEKDKFGQMSRAQVSLPTLWTTAKHRFFPGMVQFCIQLDLFKTALLSVNNRVYYFHSIVMSFRYENFYIGTSKCIYTNIHCGNFYMI